MVRYDGEMAETNQNLVSISKTLVPKEDLPLEKLDQNEMTKISYLQPNSHALTKIIKVILMVMSLTLLVREVYMSSLSW